MRRNVETPGWFTAAFAIALIGYGAFEVATGAVAPGVFFVAVGLLLLFVVVLGVRAWSDISRSRVAALFWSAIAALVLVEVALGEDVGAGWTILGLVAGLGAVVLAAREWAWLWRRRAGGRATR